jgi:aminoglycoside phosphotransferase family enzyme
MKQAKNDSTVSGVKTRLKLTKSDMDAVKKTMEKVHKEAEKKNKLNPNADMKFFEVF